ncbi:hypothetical protein SCANM63S_03218 [Streptomyces canarius]
MGAPPVPLDTTGGRADGARSRAVFQAFAEYAAAEGAASGGFHHQNYVVPLSEPVARLLGREPGVPVTVRVRRAGALPVVIRTWQNEPAILRAVSRLLPNVPECLAEGDGFAIHSHVDGVPLSSVCGDGKPVDGLLTRALAGLLAETAQVRSSATLPPLPSLWPRNYTDSQGFLQALARMADLQIRQPNWAVFGGLFAALGVPEDALVRLAERVPAMARRPYSLLHTDLHRDNVIMSYGGDPPLVRVDWELASYGDPLHDLATHLVRMRYPDHQEKEVVDAWACAMQAVRPAAVNGVARDLPHYLAFERAQSVYPDVMRAARSLQDSFDQKSLDEATARVHRALELAAEPLRLGQVPGEREIEGILHRWRAGRGGRVTRAIDWKPDGRVSEHPDFPHPAVEGALLLEGAAPAEQVFKGTAHLNTVVWAPGTTFPVVVRRKVADARRLESSFLSEHAVLRAIGSPGGGGRAQDPGAGSHSGNRAYSGTASRSTPTRVRATPAAGEIERPRVGPMRDIAATIQPEQDDLVRAALTDSVCVQGAPGTGKTAVGLHRAAYLLYTHPKRLQRAGLLILGPNRTFLTYIAEVLPSLGETGVRQSTLLDEIARHPVTGTDPLRTAAVKHDPRMAEVLRRALYERASTDGAADLVVPDGSYRWRVTAAELADLVAQVRAEEPPYAVGRERVRTRVVRRLRDRAERRSGVLPASWGAPRRALPAADRATRRGVAEGPARGDPRRTPHRRRGAGPCGGRPAGPGRAGGTAVVPPAALVQVGPLVGRRPGPARRTRRSRRTPRGLRPPRRGRGAGPVADGVPGHRPPGRVRLPDRPRRPRPGHHPVGRPRLVRPAAPPRPAGRGRGAADHRVPGAGGRAGAGQPAARPPRRRRARSPLPAHGRELTLRPTEDLLGTTVDRPCAPPSPGRARSAWSRPTRTPTGCGRRSTGPASTRPAPTRPAPG